MPPLRKCDSPSAKKNAGCPILARSLRKSGIPLLSGIKSFLKPSVVAIMFIAIALFSACRLDMQVQPKQNPFSRSDFYTDQRSERPPVEGTVARGQLRDDTYFYTGKLGNNPGDYMPFPVTKEVLDRGRERYNIYCSPCHSIVGDGNGFIPSRGFSRTPPSFHIARLQKAPLGYFYDVITNGFGIMSDYSSQIPPRDRWNIVSYIRALQLSQNATRADLPAGQSVPSDPPRFHELGSGATLPLLAPATPSTTEESK
jgi:Cytochrome C oxidase, cbb3-type, subunit III